MVRTVRHVGFRHEKMPCTRPRPSLTPVCALHTRVPLTHPSCSAAPSPQLYVGLWHEAHGDAAAARAAITAAVATPYARLSGDYMAALARVHCKRRGWEA